MKALNQLKQVFLVFTVIALLAGCAGTNASSGSVKADKPKLYDPTGTWEYIVNTPNGGSGGTMVIAGAAGVYTGALETDQFGTLELMGMDIVDQNMTASIEVMGTWADIEVSFEEDTFSGAVYLGEDVYRIEGTRVSK